MVELMFKSVNGVEKRETALIMIRIDSNVTIVNKVENFWEFYLNGL